MGSFLPFIGRKITERIRWNEEESRSEYSGWGDKGTTSSGWTSYSPIWCLCCNSGIGGGGTYTAQKLNDDRATKYNIILRKCIPLVAEHYLQSVLIKLVASKEEAEIQKTIDKALRLQFQVQAPALPQYRALVAGRTNRFPAPYRRYRGPRCFSCNQEGHIA